jgi:hypothetical protein
VAQGSTFVQGGHLYMAGLAGRDSMLAQEVVQGMRELRQSNASQEAIQDMGELR